MDELNFSVYVHSYWMYLCSGYHGTAHRYSTLIYVYRHLAISTDDFNDH